MQETESIDEYILQHIDPESDYLKALYRDTHVKLLRPRMASGHLQGRMLKMFVKMIRPRQILEIGTYSGYSALCLAEGLSEGGMLHTFEINDEQEDFTRPWLEKSPFADKIRFYIGDALELVPDLGVTFDLAFIDGDKRKYIEYYEMTLAHLSEGGYMIADNTLWDGHVLEQPRNTDVSFIDEKDIQTVIEGAFQRVFHDVMGMDIQLPLERITWREAMENYGSDKPDRRFGMLLKTASDLCEGCGFPVFEDAVKEGKCVRGINAEGCADMTRKQIDSLVEFVKTYRAKGLAYVTFAADGTVKSSFNKFLTPEFTEKLRDRFDAKPGDILLLAGKGHETYQIVGDVKNHFDDKEEALRAFALYAKN